MKKIILIVFCVAAWILSGWGIYQAMQQPTASETGAPIPLPDAIEVPATQALKHPPLDVDAMAARLPKHHALYEKLRDQSLAAYAKLHPNTDLNDPTIATALRLAVYLSLWDDFYGENLWNEYKRLAEAAQQKSPDPLLKSLQQKMFYIEHNMMSSTDDFQDNLIRDVAALEASEYPLLFKLSMDTVLLSDILTVKKATKYWDQMPRCQALLEPTIHKCGEHYRQLLKEEWPHEILYNAAMGLLWYGRKDPDSLKSLGDTLDKAFAQEAPEHPTRIAVQGRFYADYAWSARGSGWAKTVSKDGWKLFAERLDKAAEILEAGYAKYPDEATISRTMLTVELGQGQGIGRFDLWFQRAVTLDPNDFRAYTMKHYYLMERWYGTPKESFAYGLECVKTGNWAAKVPTLLIDVLDDVAERNPKIYSHPDIWKQVETVFRTYLDKYPRSDLYRSRFAKAAALGEHWAVAAEQFALLGNNWYRVAFDKDEYQKLYDSVREHTKTVPATK